MIDITSQIENGISLGLDWTRDKVRLTLSVLAELYPESSVDWDVPDEEWGSVISCGAPKAYVSAKCPLAFVQTEDETMIQQISSRLGIIVIAMQDFDAPLISVDPSVLSKLAGRPLTDDVSYDQASVNDIWWATI